MKLSMTSLLAASAALAFSLAGISVARAQSAAVPTQQQHTQSNQSETQAKSKASSDTKPDFDQLDKNHDHKLQRSEIPHSMHQLRVHFMEYDQNHDGSLSPEEYAAFDYDGPRLPASE